MQTHRTLVATGLAVLALGVAVPLLLGGGEELPWRRHESYFGQYAVDLPGEPEMASVTLGIGGEDVPTEISTLRLAEGAFLTSYADLPRELVAAGAPAALRELRTGLVQRQAGSAGSLSLSSSEDVTVDGHPGLELRAEGSLGETPAVLRGRIVLAGNRLYQAFYTGRAGALPEEALERFLGSFSISR